MTLLLLLNNASPPTMRLRTKATPPAGRRQLRGSASPQTAIASPTHRAAPKLRVALIPKRLPRVATEQGGPGRLPRRRAATTAAPTRKPRTVLPCADAPNGMRSGRRNLLRAPRPVTRNPLTVAQTPPAYPVAIPAYRRRLAALRPGRTAWPIPAQITFTNPPYPAALRTLRRPGALLRRGGRAVPTPAQAAIVNPALPPRLAAKYRGILARRPVSRTGMLDLPSIPLRRRTVARLGNTHRQALTGPASTPALPVKPTPRIRYGVVGRLRRVAAPAGTTVIPPKYPTRSPARSRSALMRAHSRRLFWLAPFTASPRRGVMTRALLAAATATRATAATATTGRATAATPATIQATAATASTARVTTTTPAMTEGSA